MSADFPDTGPEQTYFASLRAGKFTIQHCRACGKHVFYPRVLCPHCGSPGLDWVAPTGNGSVYSTSIVRRKAEAGGDYNVALIDLEEGPRLMSRVDGIALDQIRIGMQVKAKVAGQGEQALLVFVPAGTAS
jgi:uncharacterized OB-fold protein